MEPLKGGGLQSRITLTVIDDDFVRVKSNEDFISFKNCLFSCVEAFNSGSYCSAIDLEKFFNNLTNSVENIFANHFSLL